MLPKARTWARITTACLVVGCQAPGLTGYDDVRTENSLDGSFDEATSAPVDSGPEERETVDSTVDASAPSTEASDAIEPPRDAGTSLAILYASGYDPTIHVFAADPATGALGETSTAQFFGGSPSFLAVSPNLANLYAVDESADGAVGAYAIDPDTGALTFLNDVSSGGDSPVFVSVDATGKYVFVPNYDGGTVSVLPVLERGQLGAALQTLNVGVYPHMTLVDPTNHFVLVPCKGSDYVAQFVFNPANGALTPNPAAPTVATAAGAGPRHIAFHPSMRIAYLINETDSTLSAYAFDADSGTLTLPPIDTQSTIVPGVMNSFGGEVRVDSSGRWVLASNRGEDSIVVFALDDAGRMTFHERVSAAGSTPRDFTFDPSGSWIYVGDQQSNVIVAFGFDAATGTLSPTMTMVTATAPAFVGFRGRD
jgi:6-phosphogluconolactonase